MLEIIAPDLDAVRQMQAQQGRYYWSRCAELIFRRAGVVSVRSLTSPMDQKALRLYCRGAQVESPETEGASVIEGPLSAGQLQRAGLRAENFQAEQIVLQELHEARIFEPGLRVRNEEKRVSGLILDGVLSCWRTGAVAAQYLTGQGWVPVLTGTDPATGQSGPIAVRRGKQLVFGIPIFDILLRWMAVPPLEQRYEGFEALMRHVGVADQICDLVLAHGESERCQPQVRVAKWPVGVASGLTVRHDYDRRTDQASLQLLIECYEQLGVKASIGFLPHLMDAGAIRLFLRAGHEIQAHVASSSRSSFRRDIQSLRDSSGYPVCGATIHGGPKGLGFRGQTHFDWFDDTGIGYCETFGLRQSIASPVCRIYDGVPDVSHIIAAPGHYSLDRSTRPDDHSLESLKTQIPKSLERGEHVVLMNHPDIHGPQLRELLSSLDLGKTWLATGREIVNWHRTVLYQSRVVRDGEVVEIHFDAPLARAASIQAGKHTTVAQPGAWEVAINVHPA